MSDLVDALERRLATIPPKATRNYIARELAAVATAHTGTPTPAPTSGRLDNWPARIAENRETTRLESELFLAEVARLRHRIADLETEVLQLRAELDRR
jgi:uncharacterized small protein (DUF1192 family)